MANWDAIGVDALAQAWMLELGGAVSPEGDIGMRVVEMNFFASAEVQWRFLLAAVGAAKSDDELGHIAAGPLEHLLGHHGDAYIGKVEEQSIVDPRFAQMTTAAWQYQMSDEVWTRLQDIRASVANPL